jgi:hypothetical protein
MSTSLVNEVITARVAIVRRRLPAAGVPRFNLGVVVHDVYGFEREAGRFVQKEEYDD